mmetsp:Transcript_20414/g.47402  ORF Transcript_20414/g.47402 Transcript_20414/m.47402 type:complete len:202 (-) Transcript_20414:547-1152(-)
MLGVVELVELLGSHARERERQPARHHLVLDGGENADGGDGHVAEKDDEERVDHRVDGHHRAGGVPENGDIRVVEKHHIEEVGDRLPERILLNVDDASLLRGDLVKLVVGVRQLCHRRGRREPPPAAEVDAEIPVGLPVEFPAVDGRVADGALGVVEVFDGAGGHNVEVGHMILVQLRHRAIVLSCDDLVRSGVARMGIHHR